MIPFKTVVGDQTKVIVGQVHGHPDKTSIQNNEGNVTFRTNVLLPETSENDKDVAKELGAPVYGTDYTNNVHKVNPDGTTSNVSPDNSILTNSLQQSGGDLKAPKESDNAPK